MTKHYSPEIREKSVSEKRNVFVSFLNKLSENEVLIGPPVITDVIGDLTVSEESVNVASITINNVTNTAGMAVTFNVDGGAAGTMYDISISCSTSATPAQTLYGKIRLIVNAD